jgi:hypothetical protein
MGWIAVGQEGEERIRVGACGRGGEEGRIGSTSEIEEGDRTERGRGI